MCAGPIRKLPASCREGCSTALPYWSSWMTLMAPIPPASTYRQPMNLMQQATYIERMSAVQACSCESVLHKG